MKAVELWISQHGYGTEIIVLADGTEIIVLADGTEIIVLAYGTVAERPDETRRRVRHRLGTIFGAALREWVNDS